MLWECGRERKCARVYVRSVCRDLFPRAFLTLYCGRERVFCFEKPVYNEAINTPYRIMQVYLMDVELFLNFRLYLFLI